MVISELLFPSSEPSKLVFPSATLIPMWRLSFSSTILFGLAFLEIIWALKGDS